MRVEWGISRCPGDMTYYTSAEATVVARGASYTPCGTTAGAEAGGVRWNTAGSFYECRVPTTEQRFVNFRIIDQCTTVGGCPIIYSWN
jgi:hypothetical protein